MASCVDNNSIFFHHRGTPKAVHTENPFFCCCGQGVQKTLANENFCLLDLCNYLTYFAAQLGMKDRKLFSRWSPPHCIWAQLWHNWQFVPAWPLSQVGKQKEMVVWLISNPPTVEDCSEEMGTGSWSSGKKARSDHSCCKESWIWVNKKGLKGGLSFSSAGCICWVDQRVV